MKKWLASVAVVMAASAAVGACAAHAEEPAWWERCEELPSDQVERCFNEHNGEGEGPGRKPTKPVAPIRSHLGHRFPDGHSVFVNCPGNNTIGENGLACEFRLVVRHRVVKGGAVVESENESRSHTAWWLVSFRARQPAPKHWVRCGFHRPFRAFPEPVRLSAYGTDCGEARELAKRIGIFDVSPTTLRLPRRFTEGEFGTNTLGFVVSRFKCRGRVEVRQGHPNPYGHETAACRTRFGDKLTFVFNKGS